MHGRPGIAHAEHRPDRLKQTLKSPGSYKIDKKLGLPI